MAGKCPIGYALIRDFEFDSQMALLYTRTNYK